MGLFPRSRRLRLVALMLSAGATLSLLRGEVVQTSVSPQADSETADAMHVLPRKHAFTAAIRPNHATQQQPAAWSSPPTTPTEPTTVGALLVEKKSIEVPGESDIRRAQSPVNPTEQVAALVAGAIQRRFVPGNWASMDFLSSGRGREVISIDESGASKYYESRDLEAWTIILETRGFQVTPSWPRPIDQSTLKAHPRLSFLLCMSMVATDTACIQPALLGSLPRHFRVNQIPGLRNLLWRKDFYCDTVTGAVKAASMALGAWIRPGLMTHVIPCWRYPEQAAELQEFLDNGGGTVIVKPPTRGEGRGIYVAQKFEDIVNEANDPARRREHGASRVVQKMELAPALIKGRKFDLRCYVLITSMQPLRMYIWNDGLVRMAAHQYNVSQIHGSENRESWMTNTFLNKAFADVNSLTLSFAELTEGMREQGHSGRKVWNDVHEAIVDSFLLGEPAMARYVQETLKGRPCTQCFQLLGVDVLLDERYKPSVIEVNGLPSMQLSNEKGGFVDSSRRYTRLKLQLLNATINMLTLNCSLPQGEALEAVLDAAAAQTKGPAADATLDYLAGALCEQQHAGKFIRIFPDSIGAEPSRHLAAFMNWSAAGVRQLAPQVLTNAHVIEHILPVLKRLTR